MNTAPWSIAEIEIIGGHCCPRPPAPFGRGPAVVRRLDDPDSIRIAFVLDSKGAFFGTIAYGENPDTAVAKLKRLAAAG